MQKKTTVVNDIENVIFYIFIFFAFVYPDVGKLVIYKLILDILHNMIILVISILKRNINISHLAGDGSLRKKSSKSFVNSGLIYS